MGGYIINFTVYTLAMSGLIFCALFVYKKVMNGTLGIKNSQNLFVEETLSINPRKSLMIVRAGSERFLIASDVDKTTLISKLEEKSIQKEKNIKDFDTVITEIPQYSSAEELSKTKDDKIHFEVISNQNNLGFKRKSSYNSKNYEKQKQQKEEYEFSTMREMANKINRM